MAQHFLLSAKSHTLSLVEIARLSDDEAYAAFKAFRFSTTDGEPACPHCPSCTAVYEYRSRRLFKCKLCARQFSVTSGTIFGSRKMSYRDIMFAVALFVNGLSGMSALRLSRDLRCDSKTAYVLLQKVREVIGTLRPTDRLTGRVEADGKWIGGYIRPANERPLRAARRDLPKRLSKAKSIITFTETRPGGRSLAFVTASEQAGHDLAVAHVNPNARLRTDMGPHWNPLFLQFPNHRMVNHTEAYSQNGIHTNNVETINSRYRRAEVGVYHSISKRGAQLYADELAWRHDHRRLSNGAQWALLMRAATACPSSIAWKGYWKKKESLLGETSPIALASPRANRVPDLVA